MQPQDSSLWHRLQAFEFDDPQASLTFTARLARENGWTLGYAARVVDEYRRFLYLARTAGHSVTPSDAVDQAWHLHLTYSHSYWVELCEGVLDAPLHHGPTKGGRVEGERYVDQYEATLASYRTAFGQAPPEDVWPSARERFDDPARFVRVDKHRAWVLPKPWTVLKPIKPSRGAGVMLAGVPLALVAIANPLDFRGPEFLTFYAVLLISLTIAAVALRYFLRPGDPPPAEPLDKYQVAALARGVEGVVQAATASLVHSGTLEVARDAQLGPRSGEIRLHYRGERPASSDKVESRIIAICDDPNGARFSHVVDHARPAAQLIQDRLEAWGLLVPSDGLHPSRWVPACLMAIGVVVGAAKMYVGVQRDKPVGYLLLMLLVAVGLTWWFSKRPFRTRSGDRELARLRRDNHRSKQKLKEAKRQTTSDEVALAAALFGLPLVASGELALINEAWKLRDGPPTTSGSDGSSGCGSGGGDGGGGCGGGCGGCGGCGG